MSSSGETLPSFWGKDDTYIRENDYTIRPAEPVAIYVFGAFVVCGLLNILSRRLIPKTSHLAANATHIVGSIHGAFSAIMAGVCFYNFLDPWDNSPTGMLLSIEPWIRRHVAMTLGYFIYDLVNLVGFCGKYENATIIHHVFMAVALTHGLEHRFCTGFHSFLLLTEASTPFVGFHHLFPAAKPGEKDAWGTLRVLNGVTMWAAFMFFRWGLNAFSVLSIINCSAPSEWIPRGAWFDTGLAPAFWLQASLFTLSVILNVFWGLIITKGMLKKLREMSDAKKSAAAKASGAAAGKGRATSHAPATLLDDDDAVSATPSGPTKRR